MNHDRPEPRSLFPRSSLSSSRKFPKQPHDVQAHENTQIMFTRRKIYDDRQTNVKAVPLSRKHLVFTSNYHLNPWAMARIDLIPFDLTGFNCSAIVVSNGCCWKYSDGMMIAMRFVLIPITRWLCVQSAWAGVTKSGFDKTRCTFEAEK